MNTVFLVTYFWNNMEEYDLLTEGHEALGIFDSYNKAYDAIQRVKEQHEEFCKESLELVNSTEDEWYEPHHFEGYEETKGIDGTTSIVWRTVTNDIGYSCEHFFQIKEVTINDYSIENFTLSH